MSRAIPLALGIVAILTGAGLTAVIAVVWSPCAGAQMPLDPLVAPDCAAVATGPNTAWIGLLLWPVALAAAGFAIVRAISRGWGTISWAVVIVLGVVAMLANPLPEYWLLNLNAKSWDEPPFTGSLTAATFVLAGAVLIATRETRAHTSSG